MKEINNSNQTLLNYLSKRPAVYAPSTAKFWDDEHISGKMLEAHLDPEWDAATRILTFVRRSVDWIAEICNPKKRPKLLDLGCGPGIYAELFTDVGFEVTGIDLSPGSVRYAKESAAKKGKNISYHCQNYLTLDYEQEFDVITLIYCDFGVLSGEDRKLLLGKIYRALKPGGLFIVDGYTDREYEGKAETQSFSYQDSGFWCGSPYACLQSFFRYDDCHTFADQYIIIGEDKIECYNIWNHAFSDEEIRANFGSAGLKDIAFYGNAAGDVYEESSKTFCVVAQKA
jgi:SAM-dependent methyltransferase